MDKAKTILIRVSIMAYVIEPIIVICFAFNISDTDVFDRSKTVSQIETWVVFAFNILWQSHNFLIYQGYDNLIVNISQFQVTFSLK